MIQKQKNRRSIAASNSKELWPSIIMWRWPMALLLSPLMLLLHRVVARGEFDPYEMNGGLVSAVAGKDFVVVATDTRLSSSYQILGRRHVSSRLWSVGGGGRAEYVAPDGSLVVPLSSNEDVDLDNDSSSSSVGLQLLQQRTKRRKMETRRNPNVWIASAGCQADCEGLKRNLRSKLRAACAAGTTIRSHMDPASTALSLHHELYSRRGFPYYAFCLVAGLAMDHHNTIGGDNGGGCVYVYDAIGSYERVAVGCAGTGREYLQPILDRLFVSSDNNGAGREGPNNDDRHQHPHLDDDDDQQNHYHYVTCCTTPDEVVEKLVMAYRAVAEREIAVGDGIIIVSTRRQPDGTCETNIWSSPLKGH
jgi:20S proteasome subunit beta 6